MAVDTPAAFAMSEILTRFTSSSSVDMPDNRNVRDCASPARLSKGHSPPECKPNDLPPVWPQVPPSIGLLSTKAQNVRRLSWKPLENPARSLNSLRTGQLDGLRGAAFGRHEMKRFGLFDRRKGNAPPGDRLLATATKAIARIGAP